MIAAIMVGVAVVLALGWRHAEALKEHGLAGLLLVSSFLSIVVAAFLGAP